MTWVDRHNSGKEDTYRGFLESLFPNYKYRPVGFRLVADLDDLIIRVPSTGELHQNLK